MLTMMLQSPVRYNAIRSAKDGVRFNLELFVSADPRWTGRGTWFSASFDRGWSSSQRTLTDLSVPDRYQVENWSYRQQLRSGIPQGEPEFEHEAEVWKKEGAMPSRHQTGLRHRQGDGKGGRRTSSCGRPETLSGVSRCG